MPFKDPEAQREYERNRTRNHRGNPEKYLADAVTRTARYRDKNRDEINARARRDSPAGNDWSRYRMRPGTRERMRAAQQNKCILCDEQLSDNPQLVHVDHDHNCCPGDITCGMCILGLACSRCNKGCGMFGDDPDLMVRVAERRKLAMTSAAIRRATNPAPVQGQLFDINEATQGREESA
jgi:hypothetical protein